MESEKSNEISSDSNRVRVSWSVFSVVPSGDGDLLGDPVPLREPSGLVRNFLESNLNGAFFDSSSSRNLGGLRQHAVVRFGNEMGNRTTGTKSLTVEMKRVDALNWTKIYCWCWPWYIYSRRWCLGTKYTMIVNRVTVSDRTSHSPYLL